MSLEKWNFLVATGSLIVAVLVAIVPSTRKRVLSIVGRATRIAGRDRRRYRSWFASTHGRLRNIFSDRVEELSLRDTYIPLAGYRGSNTERVAASDVLRDPLSSRLIILGDPGAGKSTLLKAFGMSLIDGSAGSRVSGIPLLVSLRLFARWLAESSHSSSSALLIFLEREVLQEAGVRQPRPLLESLIANRDAVLLLDGLDEVPDEWRSAVRTAVLDALADKAVRVVLTCRRQNFLTLQSDWIPVMTDRTYTLARLSDSEVRGFINRRIVEFNETRTPEDLFTSIIDSETLELHRVPLILSVSISLYTKLPGYRIPTSLTDFYREMIKQLVTRHDFRLEAAGSVNRFRSADKLRFLREHSYRAAIQSSRFEDFSFRELVATADSLTDRLPSVRREQSEIFVVEIIDRSGLLVEGSQEADFVFAHRSIQEFLIAERLVGDPHAGVELLIARSANQEWRLVATFFAAFEHDKVSELLLQLFNVNFELCARCLAVATHADRALVAEVIGQLGRRVLISGDGEVALSALVGLAGAYLAWVKDLALDTLITSLGEMSDFADLQSLNRDSITRLLFGLTLSHRVHGTAAIVAQLADLPAADDPATIGPLWKSFWSSVVENPQEASKIACHLLQLSRTATGLQELQAQPAPDASLIALGVATFEAYPFRDGVNSNSNLPILLRVVLGESLAVSEKLRSANPYIEAILDLNPSLKTLERDRQRLSIHFSPFWSGRIVLLIGLFCGVVVLALGLIDGVSAIQLTETDSPWSYLLYLLPGFIAGRVAIALSARTSVGLVIVPYEDFESRQKLDRGIPANPLVGIIIRLVNHIDFGLVSIVALIGALLTLPTVLGLRVILPLSQLPAIWFLAVAAFTVWLVFWLPATSLCRRGKRIHLRRPNRLIDLYDHPACMHWINSDHSEKGGGL